MTSKGQSSFGQDQDDVVFIPYTTVMKKMRGITFIQQITVSAASADDIDAAADSHRRRSFASAHKIQPGEPDDFFVRTNQELARRAGQSTQTMTSLLAGIAAVSLIVGGIGIMNIMLVSVTERTREIGLRMAIGARGSDVLLQFLVEAVVSASSAAGSASRWALPSPRASPSGRGGRPRCRPTRWPSRSASPRSSGSSSASIPRAKRRRSIPSTPFGSNDGRRA